jgi:hypothetical protein
MFPDNEESKYLGFDKEIIPHLIQLLYINIHGCDNAESGNTGQWLEADCRFPS